MQYEVFYYERFSNSLDEAFDEDISVTSDRQNRSLSQYLQHQAQLS